MQLLVLSISTCFEGGHPLHLSLVLKEGRESLLLFVSAPVGNRVIIYLFYLIVSIFSVSFRTIFVVESSK